ncbi:hypothetical protein RUMGNA_01237 [Mediterraneibacter gnavus ATCC 29149]|uniref:Uncharacterized protein n=1 Tax=Mediterraneibacter gnavus (strain ATCC 29149 / DSM 114966 / JCM 6515 / VPI C7-9) TaxID=411470 RepID=A7B111_MEDG7|nr:hypothetical protein RUMGNA_01237 [Mediterraneibacter gnavus ATCC 29149]
MRLLYKNIQTVKVYCEMMNFESDNGVGFYKSHSICYGLIDSFYTVCYVSVRR